MNWIDKGSQAYECATIGNCKISRLLFADDLVLLSSTDLRVADGKTKNLGVAFTSGGWQDEELDTRVGKASAVMRALHYSVVMKRELSKKAKLSIFKAVFVPILTYGHES